MTMAKLERQPTAPVELEGSIQAKADLEGMRVSAVNLEGMRVSAVNLDVMRVSSVNLDVDVTGGRHSTSTPKPTNNTPNISGVSKGTKRRVTSVEGCEEVGGNECIKNC